MNFQSSDLSYLRYYSASALEYSGIRNQDTVLARRFRTFNLLKQRSTTCSLGPNLEAQSDLKRAVTRVRRTNTVGAIPAKITVPHQTAWSHHSTLVHHSPTLKYYSHALHQTVGHCSPMILLIRPKFCLIFSWLIQYPFYRVRIGHPKPLQLALGATIYYLTLHCRP